MAKVVGNISLCLFSSEILVNGEFRLFDEDAFERREVVLHVNTPCGSKRFYYTKSAAHCEPQIGYFKGKMSRKHLVRDLARIFTE